MAKLTQKQAALWISEAWGRDIKPRDVKHLGNWLFVIDREYENGRTPREVECIYNPKGGDLWAETWDTITYETSPFVERDKQKLGATLSKLDNAISAYEKKYSHAKPLT